MEKHGKLLILRLNVTYRHRLKLTDVFPRKTRITLSKELRKQPMMMVFPEIYLAINLLVNVGICSNIKQVDFSYIKA